MKVVNLDIKTRTLQKSKTTGLLMNTDVKMLFKKSSKERNSQASRINPIKGSLILEKGIHATHYINRF